MMRFFTLPPSLYWHARARLKQILGKMGGPEMVQKSLLKGLSELRASFTVNSYNAPIHTACVLARVPTLKWALEQKEKSAIGKIIAGPNLVVTAKSEDGILSHKLIDKIVVPSQWVKDSYTDEVPELKEKIHVWPAGVDVPPLADKPKEFDFLVYNKIGDSGLFRSILSHLSSLGHTYKVLAYGSFRQKDYFDLLERARFEIYLSNSESQGLAMFEAWARNVPTLVWERGYFEHGDYRFYGLTGSAYLMPQAGARFKDFQEFQTVLTGFIHGEYHPQQYVVENFTHMHCAKRYLEIFKS